VPITTESGEVLLHNLLPHRRLVERFGREGPLAPGTYKRAKYALETGSAIPEVA